METPTRTTCIYYLLAHQLCSVFVALHCNVNRIRYDMPQSRAIVLFSRFLPFLSDDDKDHDEITKVRRLLSLSGELSSALLALSPLFPPSGRLSAELSSSFPRFLPFLSDDDKDHDDITKVRRLSQFVSRAIVCSSRSLSPLPSFWSSVCRAIVFFSRFLPFLSTTTRTTTTSLMFAPAGACVCNSDVHATNLAPFVFFQFSSW